MDKKILIADDDPNIRSLLKETLAELEEGGVVLLFAADGDEAIKLAETERPDVFILDIMMPHNTGYDVCLYVRSKLNDSGAFIILLSARGSEISRKTSERVGANVYFSKPFDPEQLFSTVSEAIRRERNSSRTTEV